MKMGKMVLKFFKHIRWMGLIVLLIVLANIMLTLYYLKQFEHSLVQAIQHEGMLLSQVLEIAIEPYLKQFDIKGLNDRINQLAEARDQDIEINVILIKSSGSIIIASNIPDNIEPASMDEHRQLKLAIINQKPTINIGKDPEFDIEDLNDPDKPIQPGAFDFEAEKFMDIMVPVKKYSENQFGINIKLSLDPMERKKKEMIKRNIIAMVIEILIILTGLSILTFLLIRERSRVIAAESSKIQAEFKALQAQVNPHFLFNALNTLSSHIADQPDLAENLTLSLSDLYRKILSTSENGFWTIEEEVSLIQSYLNIESMRLQDRLTYAIQVDKEANQITIPSLIIFPLVENAIKHGISRFIKGGKITIEIDHRRGLFISVTDQSNHDENYPVGQPVPGEKKGMENIKYRLYLIYKNNAELSFHASESGATSQIKICDAQGLKQIPVKDYKI